MRLPIGQSSYSRADGRLAPVRLVNLFVEQAPTSPGGAVAIPRPGLVESVNAVTRAVYIEDGVYGGDLFRITGTTLYRDGVSIGTIAGSDRVQWAYTVDGLFILGGGIVYQYNGTTLTATSFPDSASVASITQINNILVAVRADTGTIYFRLPGDTVWGALDFFSAERKPDPALAVAVLGDFLYVFGSATIELFATTGDAAVPFVRIDGASINRGIKDRDSICQLDNTLFFTGEDNIDYRMDSVPTRISDHGIEERIGASTTATSFTFAWQGHTIRVLGLDSETLAYDVSRQSWTTLEFNGSPFPTVGLYDGQTTYVAGAKLWTLDDVNTDDGFEMERLFTAVAATEAPVSCDCIEVQLSPGTVTVTEEPAIIQMRWSDDQGRTWTDWKDATTGFSGEYRKRVRYRRGGMIDAPGRLYEVRVVDDVSIRFSGVEMNPPNGGRSRA